MNTPVTSAAALTLARLARRYGVAKREMLEKQTCEADDAIMSGLEYGTPELAEYLRFERVPFS